MTGPVLVCTGRAVRRFDNTAVGQPCGATYGGPVDSARVSGWRVGDPGGDGVRPAMCPGCAAPGADQTSGPAAVLEPLPGL